MLLKITFDITSLFIFSVIILFVLIDIFNKEKEKLNNKSVIISCLDNWQIEENYVYWQKKKSFLEVSCQMMKLI